MSTGNKTCMKIMFNASIALFLVVGLIPDVNISVVTFWPYMLLVSIVTTVCIVKETLKIRSRKETPS